MNGCVRKAAINETHIESLDLLSAQAIDALFYDGGETAFPSIGLKIRAKVGFAVIFPSTYWHEALPVTAGEKVVMQFYLGDTEASPEDF
jgi:predicted 2-oxoglutarate/Fe(II)-dependent dioxygenase YbiX